MMLSPCLCLLFTFGATAEEHSVLAAGASSPAAQAADGEQEFGDEWRGPLDGQEAADAPTASVTNAPEGPPTPVAEAAPARAPVASAPAEAAPAATTTPIAPLASTRSAPAPAPAQTSLDDDALGKQLAQEGERVRRLAEQLRLIESAPVTPQTRPLAPAAKAPARVENIPATPLPNAREEYADALYALGKYAAARVVYAEIADSKPARDTLIWARLQLGHCANRLRDPATAAAAFESVLSDFPDSPWARDAAWWAGEVRWWMLWAETTRRAPPALPAASAVR
jgi:tetratricopeptide (TPR) repeat protein